MRAILQTCRMTTAAHLVLVVSGARLADVDELERLFQEEGTDKQARHPGHGYVHFYSSILSPLRYTLTSMIEIGIGSLSKRYPAHMRYWWWAMLQNGHVANSSKHALPKDISYQPGASLRAWRRFFPPPARIIGLDIDAYAVARAAEFAGVEAFVCNASNPAEMARRLPAIGLVDLIIDDGDHRWSSQQRTLLNAWPYLRRGGLYCIEDVLPEEFEDDSLQNVDAQDLMALVGASVIVPNAIGRRRAATRHDSTLDRNRLIFLRKPTLDEPLQVLSRLPTSSHNIMASV